MKRPLEILYEDNHLLVVNKPAGLATIGTGDHQPGLVGAARDYLRDKYDKPGNVFVGVVQRLDAWVSGVIVLARTSKAAARLSEQFRDRRTEKTYWAILESASAPPQELPEAGELVHWIRKNESQHRMECVAIAAGAAGRGGDAAPAGCQLARLEYTVLRRKGRQVLVSVRLITGRKHQIRAQFSTIGWPVLGDGKYGSPGAFPAGIALHSRQLVLEHPVRKERTEFRADPPVVWPSWAGNREV